MASEKQVEANRANAKKSTGPKTEQGKANSRANAWKHGLTSSFSIIGESAAAFGPFLSALMNDYRPQTTIEANLVERVALILWRLRRVPPFEAAMLLAHQAEVVSADKAAGSQHEWIKKVTEEDEVSTEDESSLDFLRLLGRALLRDCASGEGFSKIARYETQLNNQLAKTLKMLQDLRESPSGKKVEARAQAAAVPVAAGGSVWQQ